jgi:hypothetical protein
MKRLPVMVLVAACLASSPLLFAGGGGGIGLLTNAGSEMLGGAPWTNSIVLDYPTGTITALEAFGYGVTRNGWKIGGFGIGFYATSLSLSLPSDDLTITGAAGGFGGVISGGAGRLGSFAYSLNVRLGAGGMAVNCSWINPQYPSYASFVSGAFAIYGAIDAEVGLVLVPAMLVSGYASLEALAVPTPTTLMAAVVPTVGVRITWGSF